MLPAFERARYVTKEEYLAALGAESPQGVLRALASKEFAPRVVKLAEESPRNMTRVLAEVDGYHASILDWIVRRAEENKAIIAADATLRVYSLALALLAHQSGLRPSSYISVPRLDPEGLLSAGGRSPNPLVERLLKCYRSAGRLRLEDLARTLDATLRLAKTLDYYHEYLVLGSLIDTIMLRLCHVRGLEGVEFRPLLLPAQDLRSIRELSLADPLSAAGALRRAHPSMDTVAEAFQDSLALVRGAEAFDLAAVLASAYVASQVLHVGPASSLLKWYLFYLRQSVLLRLALSLSEDPLARSRLKSIAERWVRP